MLSKEEVKKLKREREKILKEIRGIKNLMRGSMYNRERKCGKKSCWCSRREGGHPETMLTVHFKGEQIGISVPKEKRDEIGEMLKEYDRLWGFIEELTRINLKLMRS
jgi:hypothetical protein